MPEMPFGEGERVVDCDDDIVAKFWVERTELSVTPLDQQPRRLGPPAVHELETHNAVLEPLRDKADLLGGAISIHSRVAGIDGVLAHAASSGSR